MSKDELPNKLEMRDLPQQQQRVFSRSDAIKWGIAFIVSCVTFLAYLPALLNGFVNWDDDLYVYENQNIQSISLRLFSWMPEVVIWHPLTMLSIAVDYAIWGLNPLGYHLTNILLHAFNTFLVFILAVHLIDKVYKDKGNKKSVIVGGVTAILFGIHPLHVESVAWVSERKDVLCAFFFLLSLLTYLKYATSPAFKRHTFYALSLIFFAMSLMSKPMAVSLPIVLLIFDLYPLRRLMRGMGIKWVLIEKLPFFLLSLISSLLAIWVHQSTGAFQALEIPPFKARILEAAWAYIFYLGKMIFPTNLAPLYPHQEKISFFSFESLGSLVLLLTITFVAITYLKKDRLLPAIWFYYLVTLIPVIGIVQVGQYAAADRFLYLPSLSFLFLIGLVVGSFFGEGVKKQYRLPIVFAIIFVFGILTVKTIRQIYIWRDSITLWSHEIKLFPAAVDKAYFNIGAAYNGSGNYPLAIRNYDKGIKLNRRDTQAYFNRGFAHDNLGNYQQAIKDYTKAIEFNPLFADAFNNRGVVYNNLGNKQLAIIDLSRAIEINPQYAMAYYNLGFIYSQLGNNALAQINYDKAADLNPGLFK